MQTDKPDFSLGRRGDDWVISWYADGKRHRRRLDATTQAEANAQRIKFVADFERLSRPDNPTVGYCWQKYTERKAAEKRVSLDRMLQCAKQLGPVFFSLQPDDITEELVDAYIDKRRDAGISNSTVNTELTYLRVALLYAVDKRLIKWAPSITPPPPSPPRERYLDSDEARRLLDAAADFYHIEMFIRVSLFTAARPSAVLQLKWDRVDFNRMEIDLRNGELHRNKRRSIVPLNPELLPHLLRAREMARTEYVIEWSGKSIKRMEQGFQAACERAGLDDVYPYVLRHTAAVWMAEDGVPMEEISQYLGHSSTFITAKVYARFSPGYQQRAASAISKRLNGGAKHERSKTSARTDGQQLSQLSQRDSDRELRRG